MNYRRQPYRSFFMLFGGLLLATFVVLTVIILSALVLWPHASFQDMRVQILCDLTALAFGLLMFVYARAYPKQA